MKKIILALFLISAFGAASLKADDAIVTNIFALDQSLRNSKQELEAETKRFRALRDPNEANQSLQRMITLSSVIREIQEKITKIEQGVN